MSPPVSDSARARVSPRSRSRSRTTDSIVSSSVPNTMSPIRCRRRLSSSSRIETASASLAAFAVIRTFRPSKPLARKAIVAVPASSRRRISSSSCSARPDSDWPQVRSVRLRMTALIPARSARSGSTPSSTICFISHGTPGTAYMTLPWCSPPSGQISPAAVPGIAGLALAPAGTSA